MSKPTKKRHTYNALVVKALSEKYSLSTHFVRMCIRNQRKSLTSDRIRAEYNEMAGPLNEKIENFKNEAL